DMTAGELDATDAMELDIPSDMDEVGTKLDLAKAYIDMGDPDGAKSILDEVMTEGTPPQQQEAQQLMQQI
ncbi:MAG: tetratricopeptide repeat protein, partial [Gammaproteobacteria bacterium]|nr:tetratricopeptide repeat protein [Gammaproteobacteria bacterium]